MKRKLIVLSVLAILLAIVAVGTIAYFTSESTAHNVITTGGVEIKLLEWADNEKTKPFKDLIGVMPNTTVTKIAEVENTGESSAWVRVKVEKEINLADGVEAQVNPALVVLDINTADWTQGGDGYLYYNKALLPGQKTEPIFTSVSFKSEMDNDYQSATVIVDITAHAVQTANNGDNAMAANGWPSA
jgi:predicted ribosomally synthesized peptide with SipW-like signal peptide